MNEEIMVITDVIKETVDCEKIYLFGSFAYGEPSADSDLDIYVVIPDDSVLRPIEVMRAVRQNLGKMNREMPLDILASRASRFSEMSALPTMERKIVRDGVLLYEQNGNGQRMA